MRALGIDMGSREVKIVCIENDQILLRKKMSTMSFYRDFCSYDGRLKVQLDKIIDFDVDVCISTGYGRNNIDLDSFTPINEIKAHSYGAIYQSKESDFILLDVGGQDVKVIKIEKGIVTDLDLNEKCAASCGRYLENMAHVLEVDLDELSKHHEDPVHLNSTCAVFSESELIGKIAEGISIEKLCAGVNYSMYKRLDPILNKFPGVKLIVSGGVAHNGSIIKYLSDDYDEVKVVEDPQFNGAIGCCYYGLMKINKSN